MYILKGNFIHGPDGEPLAERVDGADGEDFGRLAGAANGYNEASGVIDEIGVLVGRVATDRLERDQRRPPA